MRGEIWFAATPGGDRPVLVLTRDPVAERIGRVVVAALTRTTRGLVSELELTPAIRSSSSTTSSCGVRVSISAVAPARNSGSTAAASRTIRSRSSSLLPKSLVVREAIRSIITSRGALSNTTASNRGANVPWFRTVPETNSGQRRHGDPRARRRSDPRAIPAPARRLT
jgi:hypothetical protein